MTFTYDIPCLDLAQIAQSGQCFRMNPLPNPTVPREAAAGYGIISLGRMLRIWQKGTHIWFECREDEIDFWLGYFDVSRDYEAIWQSVDPADSYLTEAARLGRGIRILRQDPWEMIITFIISQQKTIPKIKELVEALCTNYGSPLEQGQGFAFPSPLQLSQASLEDLSALKLGYRAKYIHRICRDVVSGALDLDGLTQMNYQEAMDYLTGFYGIGKKVANCVCLFGLHHVEAFPVDTWIEKILREQYYNEIKYKSSPKAKLWDIVAADAFGRYKGCAGIMQQYIFYYERQKNGKLS